MNEKTKTNRIFDSLGITYPGPGRASVDPAWVPPPPPIARKMNTIAPNVYLAGKVSKNCWRNTIVDLRCASWNEPPCSEPLSENAFWPMLEVVIKEKHVHAKLDYVGPYFVSCDHGCFHGDRSHGMMPSREDVCRDVLAPAVSDPVDTRSIVRRLCLDALRRADIVFAWIESLDAFGTLFELGYAASLGKRIVIAAPYDLDLREWWFALQPHRIIRARETDLRSILAEAVNPERGTEEFEMLARAVRARRREERAEQRAIEEGLIADRLADETLREIADEEPRRH